MCWASSFFSRMIEAQLATGATQDMRILTGSCALTAVLRPNAHTMADAIFNRRMLSSQQFADLDFALNGHFCANSTIVGAQTDFGKPRALRRCSERRLPGARSATAAARVPSL